MKETEIIGQEPTDAQGAPAETREKEPCPECEGKGTDAEGETCIFCKGTGDKAFKIDSKETAEWLLKKLSAIEAERALIKFQTQKREAELKSDHDRLMFRHGADLRAWAREEANCRRRQSVTLMYGTLAFRAQSSQLVIGSEADALTTARAVLPSAITTETVEHFDKDAYLAYAAVQLEQTGELVTGVTKTEAGESFSLTFKRAKGED
jgi:hypothetical protein